MDPSQYTILTVDDNPANTMIQKKFLSSAGFQVIKAGSGQECLEICQEQKIDLVFLDVMMPDLDGLQTCAQLKATDQTAHIPVIFLSAKDSPADVQLGLEAGAAAYMPKPSTKKEIVDTAFKFLGLET